MITVPEIRIRPVNCEQMRPDGDYVLYWMVANRRGVWNFSLQRAVQCAQKLNKPLVVFEALRSGYRWASDRLHHFIIQGMADNAAHFRQKPVLYFPYLEPSPGDDKGLLGALAKRACVVVSDDFPCFFLPRMLEAAESQIPVRFELIDSNGLLPMRAADKVYLRAYDFRRFLQKNLRPYLSEPPEADPLHGVNLPTLEGLPAEITKKWPMANVVELADHPEMLSQFPIDHQVCVTATRGGSQAATQRFASFVVSKLMNYEERNQPEQDVASGLSPYLHFGHISAHQVFADTVAVEDWSVDEIGEKASGSSRGWWGVSEPVESFLDELITWRELGYNMCSLRDDYNQFESLPDWAQATLELHERDPREHIYSPEEFECAKTHDELWNAAQRELLHEGRIHNYLRMLWGKKILEWTETPRDALDIMIELNNKYALDGRNPNSYSGIFWVLGRYDRAWGPERPIFGKIRYMSSENTARKVRVKDYIQRFGRQASLNFG